MEAERPQEEEEDDQHQGPHQDEHDWPPMNTSTRPWRSAPPSPPPSGTRHTALGPRSASLLSLQTELLLDLVAEAQSRRLEEQRATFHIPQNPPSRAPAPHRPLEDREQLYSTILSHQCQRMEAQRSEPPLPPGGQELLELLLRVQVRRQRHCKETILPPTTSTPSPRMQGLQAVNGHLALPPCLPTAALSLMFWLYE
ncbi:G-protein-signaling modulator 3 isoform X1 [Meles meles]|uniref:G-protein-signaling modulator 3 isoform X1 n=1 Tax=Meles meles TaxID=9662 RepID=UPI001E69FCA9|nr:G-protein-signaling modulator 3 isoform X1 [Meles meles]